jgi:hypothetical protein
MALRPDQSSRGKSKSALGQLYHAMVVTSYARDVCLCGGDCAKQRAIPLSNLFRLCQIGLGGINLLYQDQKPTVA